MPSAPTAASLQAAFEKNDAGALALLQQTTAAAAAQPTADQILDWQVQQAQNNIDALNQALALAQQKYNFNYYSGSSPRTKPREQPPV